MPNQLSDETSPYLLQHADNPVDWYPWGPAAFDRARAEDRPILLSVGYSACHWCHVMAHESFEDPDTARLMNELYVNVKVDREERPDVDSVYMTAVQALTGRGGWPMTVFMTPEGSPFFGGTYYPPTPRHGLPSFRQVLQAVADAYGQRRDDVLRSADSLRQALQQSTRLDEGGGEPDTGLLDVAFARISASYDTRHGGFGEAPKFPQPMALEALLRHGARTGDELSLQMASQSLVSMARGGMYDQVGGGFHRYSVDAHWLVPHFEKMLYDNALLSRIYVEACQATGDEELREVGEDILRYVQREMMSPEGGFYSAQDADSEGEEGRFYVWTSHELDEVLAGEDGAIVREWYGVTAGGNFEGSNILHVAGSAEDVAAAVGVDPARVRDTVHRARKQLYEARARRVAPALDDKIITSWNALMLQSFAVAARVLDDDGYRAVAERNATFLLAELRRDGRLLRTWRRGRATIPAFLEDYAVLADALLSLYEATGDVEWIREARTLADAMIDLFRDEREGIFYDTARDGEQLVVRPRNIDDNAMPSGNSAATLLLLRLSVLTGDHRYERLAVTALRDAAGLLERAPLAFGRMLAALDFHLAPRREVVIAGDPRSPDMRELLDVLRRRYDPNLVMAMRPVALDESAAAEVPLLAERGPVDGRAAAFVCRNYACDRPVTDPDALRAALAS
jgi:uncharacterized protein